MIAHSRAGADEATRLTEAKPNEPRVADHDARQPEQPYQLRVRGYQSSLKRQTENEMRGFRGIDRRAGASELKCREPRPFGWGISCVAMQLRPRSANSYALRLLATAS